MTDNNVIGFDFENRLRSSLNPTRRANNQEYFLMQVKVVAQDPNNPRALKVAGIRLDNEEKVIVETKANASGQHLPVKGSLMRADKVKITGNVPGSHTKYTAEYYHAYGENDFCLEVAALARRPQDRAGNGRFSADVMFADTTAHTGTLTIGDLAGPDGLKKLLPFMKPWEFEGQSKLTHDINGKSLWETPLLGVSPMLNLRIGLTSELTVFGASVGLDDSRKPVLPTDAKIMETLQSNRVLMEHIEVFRKEFTRPEDPHIPIEVIPMIRVAVGHDCLNGENEKYLKVKQLFELKGVKGGANENENPERRVWRDCALAHLKVSRQNRLLVVDMVPGGRGETMRKLPFTANEQVFEAKMQKAREAQMAESLNSAPEAPKQTAAPDRQPAQQPQAASAAPQKQAASAFDSFEENVFADQPNTSPAPTQQQQPQSGPRMTQAAAAYMAAAAGADEGDFTEHFFKTEADFDEVLTNDIAAMEAFNRSPEPDQGLEDAFEEAQRKLESRSRYQGPKM
jgi:hypothetical protein